MKFLKILGVLILVIFALFLIVPIFLPKNTALSRSVVIAVAPKVAYDRVIDFKTWQTWDPFSATEPTAQFSTAGAEKKIGYSRSWSGKKIGSGTMTLSALEEGKHLSTAMTFGKEPGTSEAFFDFEPVTGGTKVTWGYHQENLKYPGQRIMGLMMNPMLGGAFDKGLANLKKVLEEKK